jgi:hypothetical protein
MCPFCMTGYLGTFSNTAYNRIPLFGSNAVFCRHQMQDPIPPYQIHHYMTAFFVYLRK